MDGFRIVAGKWIGRIGRIGWLATAGLLLASCATFDNSWVPGSAASMAKDQIMLVRREPPSFGFHRLETQSRDHPDLGYFVRKQGLPDFLAETSDQDRRYFILYYLKARQAYACRIRRSPKQVEAVEFAGPYPITVGEYRRLDGFQGNDR